MKKAILFIFLVLNFVGFSQSNFLRLHTIMVINNQQDPMPNIPVTLIETSTKQRISKTTNNKGEVVFEIKTGKEWAVNILEMKNCSFIYDFDKGYSTGRNLITYDIEHYRRKNRLKLDRKSLKITTIDQTKLVVIPHDSKTASVKLKIVKDDDSPLKNFAVNLTSYKLEQTFLGKTNEDGIANFIVPINTEFDIDIDGIDSFDYIDTKKAGTYNLQFTYEPTNIKETVVNDTIVQSIPRDIKGTSTRIAVKLKVNKLGGNDVSRELIYLQMLGTNKIYKGKMDKEGNVSFLLPNRSKYLIHFKYQKDVDVLNFSHMRGISNSESTIIYKPEPKLEFPEKFIPTPDQLFLKEFRDFITKQYPEPTDPLQLHVKWANDSINALSKEAVLELGFKIRTSNYNLNGPPINLSLVVDRSGSMYGDDRIVALKKALLNFTTKLRKTDIVSLVSYDDKAILLVPSQPVGDGKYLKDMIEDIEIGGGTNIYNGMVMGYEQIEKKKIAKGTNRVVLLTDGYGADDPLITIKKSKEYNDKGIELSTIGVGEGYNQALLSQLASTGGGLLNFIGSSKNIESVFQKELTSLLSPCVSDVKIEIEYNDKIVFKQLYGFPFKHKEGNSVQLKLDAIYAGLQGVGLLKFDLNHPDKSIEKSPIIIKMTYYDPNKLKYDEKIEKVYLKWLPKEGKIELILEAEQKKIYAIAVLNQGLKVMSENFAQENYKEAIEHIINVQTNIKQIFPNAQDKDVQKLMDQMSEYSSHLSRYMFNTEVKN
jgi:uncharacterized protein YegL